MAFCSVLDIWGDFVEGNFLVTDSGDKDFFYEPTERGLLPVDWTRQPTVFIPLQLTDQELPDSRQALKKVLDRYKQKKTNPSRSYRIGVLSTQTKQTRLYSSFVSHSKKRIDYRFIIHRKLGRF